MPRRFIRHPASIPIQLDYSSHSDRPEPHIGKTRDVSAGGLSCYSDKLLSPGDFVEVRISIEDKPFKTIGHVIWCRRNNGGYLLGIGFSDMATAYAVRMVEQICHIEEYRLKVKNEEGRELNSEEAAMEWINIHAADFHQNGY
ncbi:MAG: PilZ domain-containing protein [Neptuniibacter sp.]